MLLRLALYFRPHLFASLGGVAFTWGVRWVLSLDGSCRAFCYPPITVGLGLLAGLMGAQMYRSDHPIAPPRRRDRE